MSSRPEIYILDGELAGRCFEVPKTGLRLGRSSSNDIHIPDEELSRNHCLFEPVGEDGIRVTDLVSANGTTVNGTPLAADPVTVRPGDIIEVGATHLRIGKPTEVPVTVPAPSQVDLGLGAAAEKGPVAENAAAGRRRSPLANILWGVAVLTVVAAIGLLLFMPAEESAPVVATSARAEGEPVLREAYFEKVEADNQGIFRYEMRLTGEGVLSVRVDDVPAENRHHAKSLPLGKAALEELGEILAWKHVKDIDREYAGVEPDPPALNSWTLKVVYTTRTRTIHVVNTVEPEAFQAIREKLEAFSKSALGIWAIQYPRERLVELAEAAVKLGESKWTDRDVSHGNLAAAIAAYREALFYVETVNPKPPAAAEARAGLDRSEAELQKRYADQRFRADRALNLAQWEEARRELMVLLEMVPDRKDDRNRDARLKLVSAERNAKKGARK